MYRERYRFYQPDLTIAQKIFIAPLVLFTFLILLPLFLAVFALVYVALVFAIAVALFAKPANDEERVKKAP